MALMNAMCNISQFVVVESMTNESFATLAENFVQHVFLKFGICHLVAIDDCTQFKGVFVSICKDLDLNYDILVKGNHKGLTIENFRFFLNKAVTIEIEFEKVMISSFQLG